MTVAATTPRIAYAGDGVTVAFAVPFTFDTSADLVVIATTGDVQTTWTLGANYTVSGGAGATGTVTATAAPASGTTLNIYRKTPETQPVDYRRNDPFPAETHEAALDRLQRQIQELWAELARCLRLTPGEASTTTTLATPATRASKLLGFTAGGALDYLTNAPGSGTFLGLPTSLTFPTGGKVLFQTSAGAGGATSYYADVSEIQAAPLERLTFTTSTTISSADSGKVISNSGTAFDVTFTLPAGAAGLWYVIENDTTTQTVTIDPNGSEVIRGGGAGKYLRMLTPGAVVIEWNASTSRWDVNEGFNLVAFEP